MSDIGWPTPGDSTLNLTSGFDFTWSYRLNNSSGSPVNFPAGRLFLQFPTVDGASFGVPGPTSGSMWKWTIYGSVATITVPAAVVDLIPDGVPWHLVWVPADEARFDSAGSGSAGGSAPSWTHSIAGDAVVVFANLWTTTATPDPVTATCGGVEMDALATVANYYSAGAYVSLYAFGLLNPPQGSTTISLDVDSVPSHFVAANSLSYFNVDSFEPSITQSNIAGQMKLKVHSTSNRMVSQSFSAYTYALSNYNQTQRFYFPFTSQGYPTLIMGDAPIQNVAHQPELVFTANQSTTYPYAQPWAGIAVPMVPKAIATAAGYSTNSGVVSKT